MLFWPDTMESPDGRVVKLTVAERERARKYPALMLQWQSQAFRDSEDLPNLAYFREYPHKAAELTDVQYLADHLFIGRKYYQGDRPHIIQPRSGPSPAVMNMRAQVPSALEAHPGERELTVGIRRLDGYNEPAYRNNTVDPQGLYYVSYTYNRPSRDAREGMNRADFTPVIHRLAPDGSDTPQLRIFSDFFSSRDVDERTKDLALRTLLTRSRGFENAPQISTFLSFFPYEVRNGKNYREELARELTEILRVLNLKDAETHLLFFRELIKQLERYGGCTERASREISKWFNSSQTNPLWEHVPRVRSGTYRSPGRAPTTWPKMIYF
jgi:hypothetical protein